MFQYKINTPLKPMMALLAIAHSCQSMEETSSESLDPSSRPDYVQKNINKSFDAITQHDALLWPKGGAVSYKILSKNYEDSKTIDAYLQNRFDQGQSEVSILDVGAGNFTFGKALSIRINNRYTLPKGSHATIISMRGEVSTDQEMTTDNSCTRYDFGAFKIENIKQELSNKGLSSKIKADLIVCSWTIIYFTDPLGTLQRLLNMLNPASGLLFINQTQDIRLKDSDGNPIEDNSKYLFLGLKQCGLDVLYGKRIGDEYGWAIKRSTNQKIRLPFSYDLTPVNSPRLTQKGQEMYHTHYTVSQEILSQADTFDLGYWDMYGSQALYDELTTYNPNFCTFAVDWGKFIPID